MKIIGKKCLVKGCENERGQGTFVGDLCKPCHEMLTTGRIHPNNGTFVGDLLRETKRTRREWMRDRVSRTLNPTFLDIHEIWCTYRTFGMGDCTCDDFR